MDESNSLPLIAGVCVAGVCILAIVVFAVWKARRGGQSADIDSNAKYARGDELHDMSNNVEHLEQVESDVSSSRYSSVSAAMAKSDKKYAQRPVGAVGDHYGPL